jgi:uncharacterized membrane protein
MKVIDKRHFRIVEKHNRLQRRTVEDAARETGKEIVMNRSLRIASAVAAAVALPVIAAKAGPVAPQPNAEKCFGVAKAGSNDCQTATNSCAGSVNVSRGKDAWIYLPKGLCQKIAGGSLQAKK